MTEQEMWEAALVKCGVLSLWCNGFGPRHRRKRLRDNDIEEINFGGKRFICDTCGISCDAPPALGDAAAVVAMLEWGKQHEMGVSYDKLIGEWMATCAKNGEHLGEMSPSWIECYHKSLPLALAAAVNEVQP